MAAAFPRPGRVLKAILATIGVTAIVGAIIVNWVPGGHTGSAIFAWLAFSPQNPTRVWTWLTSGVLTAPTSLAHALFALMGLYFLGTDLERRWGGARLLRFLLASIVIGNVAVFAVNALPLSHGIFHPGLVFGPMAAITATAMAWAKENAHRQIRLFFVLPVSGRALYWITIGFAVLAILFMENAPEGAAATFGGIVAGLILGGSPSPVRSLWLGVRLFFLRRKGHTMTVDSVVGSPSRNPSKRPARSGPPLRVVQGGLEDDLKGRKPPKDKRYLN